MLARLFARLFSSRRPSAPDRLSLAVDPETPVDVLIALLRKHPEQVGRNPTMQAALARNPRLLDSLDADLALRMLMNVNLPVDLIVALGGHPNPAVADAAGWHFRNPNGRGHTTETIRDALAALLLRDAASKWALAQTRDTPRWLLWRLAGDLDGAIRAATLRRPDMDFARELLHRASGTLDFARTGPAPRRTLRGYDFQLLAEGPIWFRHLAARHPETPPHFLERLADDPDTFVRVRVARNPSTSPVALERFARSETVALRVAAARNPALPETLLAELADDPSPQVQTVLRHRDAAMRTAEPEPPRRVPQRPKPRVTPQAPEIFLWARTDDAALLARLTGDADWKKRFAAACNPSLAPELRERLKKDGHAWVRSASWHRTEPREYL